MMCSASSICTRCHNPYNLYSTFPGTPYLVPSCVVTCPNNSYPDNFVCVKCDQSCKTCSGPAFNNCLTCDTTIYTFVSSRNTCECRPTSYYNGSSCLPCHPSCSNCLNPLGCQACNKGYYLPFNPFCSPCNEECESCSSTPACLTCSDAKNRQQSGSKCPCKPKFFERSLSLAYDSTLQRKDYNTSVYGSCIPCSDGCYLCKNEQICLECTPHDNRILRGGYCPCKPLYQSNPVTKICEPYSPPGAQALQTATTAASNYSLQYYKGGVYINQIKYIYP